MEERKHSICAENISQTLAIIENHSPSFATPKSLCEPIYNLRSPPQKKMYGAVERRKIPKAKWKSLSLFVVRLKFISINLLFVTSV